MPSMTHAALVQVLPRSLLFGRVIGLSLVAIILATLLFEGLRNISPAIFTQMTPPPGADGGLLNAITGSLIMTTLGVAFGTR